MVTKKKVGNRILELPVAVSAGEVEVEFSPWMPVSFHYASNGYTQKQVVTVLQESVYLVNWQRWQTNNPAETRQESWSVVVTNPTAVRVAMSHFSLELQAQFKVAQLIKEHTNLVVQKPKWQIIPVGKLPSLGCVDKKVPSQKTKLASVAFKVCDAIVVKSESGFDKGQPVERFYAYVAKTAFPDLATALGN